MTAPVCVVDGCPKAARRGEWCQSHHYRVVHYGTPTPACTLPGCTTLLKRAGYCATHLNRFKKYGTPLYETTLDVGPLLDHVDRLGGTDAVLAAAGLVWGSRGYRQHDKTLYRARANGHITAVAADQVCIEVLGVHPAWIFGEAWWVDDLEQVAS